MTPRDYLTLLLAAIPICLLLDLCFRLMRDTRDTYNILEYTLVALMGVLIGGALIISNI